MARVAPDRDARLQGHYAGIVSRLAAFVIDVFTMAVVFALTAQVIDYLLSALLGREFTLKDAPIAASVLLAIWVFGYCAYPLAVSGHTFGMAILGLKVVRADGNDVNGRHAVVRVLTFPVSFLVFGIGFLLILVKRDRRALHDVFANTAVVYAWDARSARLRFLARQDQAEPAHK